MEPVGGVPGRGMPRHRRGHATLLGVLIAAVTVVAVPLSVASVPNLAGYALPSLLRDFGVGTGWSTALLRAYGLALPALIVGAAAGAHWAARGRGAAPLMAGLALIGVADVIGSLPLSLGAIEAARLLRGFGGGLVMAGTLALCVWRGGRLRTALTVWWCVVLLAGLVVAAPLAQVALAETSWRAPLRPYPWLTGIGLLLSAPLLAARSLVGQRLRHADRALLAAPMMLAGTTAVLMVGATYQWPASAQLIVASVLTCGYVAVAGAGCALLPAGQRTGLPLTAVATGVAVPPTLAGVLGARTFHADPAAGLDIAVTGVVVPMAAAVLAAAVGVAIGAGQRSGPGRRPSPAAAIGLMLTACGLFAIAAGGTGGGTVLATAGWALLGGGLGLAWGTGLCATPTTAGATGALLAVQLVFPATAAGFLLYGSLLLRAVAGATRDAPIDTATFGAVMASGVRLWAPVAGGVVLATAVGALLTARRGAEPAGEPRIRRAAEPAPLSR